MRSPQNLVKADPLSGIVSEHCLDQTKQLLVLLLVRLLVLLQPRTSKMTLELSSLLTNLERFAVFSHIFACGAVLVPDKLARLEVFCLRSSRHSAVAES